MSKNSHKPGHMTIGELRKGLCSEAIREAIQEATERTLATHKPSKVTIELTIKPGDEKAQEVEMVAISDEIKLKLPKLPQNATFFFVDPETNEISRDNPAQFIPGTKSAV